MRIGPDVTNDDDLMVAYFWIVVGAGLVALLVVVFL